MPIKKRQAKLSEIDKLIAAIDRLGKISIELKFPERLVIQHQHLPAKQETDKPVEELIPEDILNYVLGESDAWAQEARKRRARELKRETGSWDAAFRMLQQEDSSG